MFPDFLCIGAQRAGTTWLYENLRKHPDLWLPSNKELHYFNRREIALSSTIFERLFVNDLIPSWLEKNDKWRFKTFKERTRENLYSLSFLKILEDLDNYLNYRTDKLYTSIFSPHTDKVTGEITPAYSTLSEESIAHIHNIMPNTKIIFIMRNPIQRAWSHSLKDIKRNKKILNSVSATEFINKFNSEGNRLRGDYLRIINGWSSFYSRDRFFIGFFEEMLEAPESFLRHICDFLEIEASRDYINSLEEGKINSYANRYRGKMPQSIGIHLAQMYYPEIEKLHNTFGGYTAAWLEYANELLAT